MSLLRSEYAANQSLASSLSSHKGWAEPSVRTRMRVISSQPRSVIGRVLKSLWAWL